MSEALITRNYAREICDLIDEAVKAYSFANEDLQRLELEFSDLYHAFELLKLNAADMARIGSETKANRIERRNRKNAIERLRSFVNWSEENKISIKNLNGVAAHIDRIIKQQNERVYTPRVRKDLTKSFREDLRK